MVFLYAATAASCHAARLNTAENPPPLPDHAVSFAPVRYVPPTEVSHGDDDGHSGSNFLQPMKPVDPVPLSPDAAKIEIPVAPSFMNSSLPADMWSAGYDDSPEPQLIERTVGGFDMFATSCPHFSMSNASCEMNHVGTPRPVAVMYCVSSPASPK